MFQDSKIFQDWSAVFRNPSFINLLFKMVKLHDFLCTFTNIFNLTLVAYFCIFKNQIKSTLSANEGMIKPWKQKF